ncbi:phosphotransferase family protein [Lederbergia citrea]|uniref:phosphotransferase family protein n=1 Tax=Lederbergia citrea TaxID=2833581 RepID=UPI002016A087|nr:aminoglycoside phosphotransferase family protein [Lederbergia citrea]
MKPVIEKKIPEKVLKWIVESVNPNAKVQSISQLHGGVSSLVHRVSLIVGKNVEEYVVRRVDNKKWVQEEPDLALQEAESLRRANESGVGTPQIIAYDETGAICGMPTVLMSKLEGTVILKPNNMNKWIEEQAKALVNIHKVKADEFPWTYYTYQNMESFETPAWSPLRKQWEEVISIVKGPRPKFKEVFIHRDYHPNNVLWSGEKISGVVDWVSACRGPAGIDVGHCRVNLAQLYGVETADAFLRAYKTQAGKSFNYDPYWDLVSLIDILFGPPEVYPGWTALGITGLSDQLIAERTDAYMLSLLKRIR